MSNARRALLVALCLALPRAPALAQDVPPGAVEPARPLFEQGVAALRENRYADAITLLERSYALRASPVVLYNLALALRGAGRYREAVQAFERYLRQPSASATPAELGEIERELPRMRAALVPLQLFFEPPPAR